MLILQGLAGDGSHRANPQPDAYETPDESGGGFGFEVTLGYGGKESGQDSGYVAGGDVVAVEEAGDVPAGSFAG